MPLVEVATYQFATYSSGYLIPYQFTSKKVVIELSSVEGQLFEWIRAGWINEVVAVNGISAKSYIKSLRFTRTALTLKPFRIPYQLEFVPQRWVRDALLKVWEFTPAELFASSSLAQSTTPKVLIAKNPNRKGVTVFNKAESRLLLNTGVNLEPGGYYETPFDFIGDLVGAWESEGSGLAEIKEFY